MFDVPVESTYVWVGLAAVSVALVGLALQVPTAPPPDASALARTVDAVAASPYEAMAEHPLDAARIRLGSERVGLAGPGGTAHATFTFDTVIPVVGGRLADVLHGEPPARVFADREAFGEAIAAARTTQPRWRSAPSALVIRRVSWGEVDATLVGA